MSTSLSLNEPYSCLDAKDGEKSGRQLFRRMHLAALASLLSAVTTGMTLGYSAATELELKCRNSTSLCLDDSQISWFGSVISLGGLVGCLLAAPMADNLGRKMSIMLNYLPFIGSYLLLYFGQSSSYIIAGRALSGISAGMTTVTVPLYLVEISTPEVRGLLGASFQLFICIGYLLVIGFGFVFNWRRLSLACVVIAGVSLALLLPFPESPRWLLKKRRRKAAVNGFLFLQGPDFDAEAEITSIEMDMAISSPNFQVSHLLKKSSFLPLCIGMFLMFFQQFSGVNSIMFNLEDVFSHSKSSLTPMQSSCIVGVVQILACIVSTLLIDRAGRRILLIVGNVGVTVGLAILGAFYKLMQDDYSVTERFGWVPLMSLLIFIAFFNFGLGPIPWMIIAEMTPVNVRGFITSIVNMLSWLFAFIVTKSFISLEAKLKLSGAFWVYAVICGVGIFYMFFCIPETKGKTLDEIEKKFDDFKFSCSSRNKDV